MSSLSKLSLRRTLLALGAVAAVTAFAAEPAAADHGRRWRGGRGPHVGVFVGLPFPPVVLVAGRPSPYYDSYGPYDYDRGYERRPRGYDRGYEDGYDDGYDDRAREEWRRRQYRYRCHYDCND